MGSTISGNDCKYIFDLCGLEWPGEGGAPLGVLPEGAAHVDLARVGQHEAQPQLPVEVGHAEDLNLACSEVIDPALTYQEIVKAVLDVDL